MIEGIKQSNYKDWYTLNHFIKAQEEVQPPILFEENTVLASIENYTYTEYDNKEDKKQLERPVEHLWNIKEEDLCKLYSEGIDIETLKEYEIPYYIHSSKARDNTKLKEKEVTAEDKVQTIKQHSDGMYLYTLMDKEDITIERLYENSFKGSFKKKTITISDYEIQEVLKFNQITDNKSSRWASELLMMYDIGVTAPKINKLQNIQCAVKALDPSGKGVSNDTLLYSKETRHYEPDYIHRITDHLGMVTDEHIEKLMQQKQEITIETLENSINAIEEDTIQDSVRESIESKISEQGINESSQERDYIESIKQQVLQIATRLTVQAAQKISMTMPIESSSLSKVAEALSQMEIEIAKEALQAEEVSITEAHVEQITQTMSVKDRMPKRWVELMGIAIKTDEKATLSDIERVFNQYEKHALVPESRWGETLSRIESQIVGVLEGQGLSPDEQNKECAKALILNQLEVTPDNIDNIKSVAMKVSTFIEEMTPTWAARMIKEGINPYYATINQALNFIGNEQTEKLKNSIAETIVELEHQGVISETQKEGMIGLYRIIQGVSKNKEQIVGYLFRNKLSLTIENLDKAIAYSSKRRNIDTVIDDSFGPLEENNNELDTSKGKIENSYKESRSIEEQIGILEKMAIPIEEENSHSQDKIGALLYPYIKEQFKKSIGKFEGLQSLPDSFREKLEGVKNVEGEVLKQLVAHKIPLTLNNIYWAHQMREHKDLYTELLEQSDLLQEELPSNLKEMEISLEQTLQQVKDEKEAALLEGDLIAYQKSKKVEEAIAFQKQQIEKEGFYQIPFLIEGEKRLINLYVYKEPNKNDQRQNLKLMINYRTQTLGEIKTYVELKEDKLTFRMACERNQEAQILDAYKEELVRNLESIGYQVQASQYTAITKQEAIESADKQSVTFNQFETKV